MQNVHQHLFHRDRLFVCLCTLKSRTIDWNKVTLYVGGAKPSRFLPAE